MNINQTNNQSFGMAFRVNQNGAKRLAQIIHNSPDAKFTEKCLLKYVVEPLSKVKSEVMFDGEKVLVTDAFTKRVVEVLDNNKGSMQPWAPSSHEVCFHIFDKSKGTNDIYRVHYPERQDLQGGIHNKLALKEDDDLKLYIGREIAKDMDAQEARRILAKDNEKQKEIDATASRLFDLLG